MGSGESQVQEQAESLVKQRQRELRGDDKPVNPIGKRIGSNSGVGLYYGTLLVHDWQLYMAVGRNDWHDIEALPFPFCMVLGRDSDQQVTAVVYPFEETSQRITRHYESVKDQQCRPAPAPDTVRYEDYVLQMRELAAKCQPYLRHWSGHPELLEPLLRTSDGGTPWFMYASAKDKLHELDTVSGRLEQPERARILNDILSYRTIAAAKALHVLLHPQMYKPGFTAHGALILPTPSGKEPQPGEDQESRE